VSEVSSTQGPGGFFPGVNVVMASLEGFLSEVIDTGNTGSAGTFRTNLGLNALDGSPVTVTVAIHNNSGAQTGSKTLTVPGNGMAQINSIVRELLSSGGNVTGQNGHLKYSSNRPIIAWASKVENGTGDPSFQIGIPAPTSNSSPPPAAGDFIISISPSDTIELLSDDGQYLGWVSYFGRFDSMSVFNEFGQYGGKFSSTSIFNDVGKYGSSTSSFSPFNGVASRPPTVFRNAVPVGRLTTNRSINGAIDPWYLLGYIRGKGY
jgi:hypothetical protein